MKKTVCIIEKKDDSSRSYYCHLSKELKDSNTLIKKLENLEGVEFIFPETCYLIRIDIGKCFDEERVIDNVRKAVLVHFNTEII